MEKKNRVQEDLITNEKSRKIGKAADSGNCGCLFICATPIGNLGDMTPRVIEALREADLIAAEDTRNSIRLLNHFAIKTPMTSYHEFNKYDKAEELVRKMQEGKRVAIITDAGTPCISDPGEVLVQKCCEAGIPVTSLPGASAVITALSVSGLSVRRFVFEGFLPPVKNKKEWQEALSRLRNEMRTMVLYEAPHHLEATLSVLCDVLGGNRRISLCRELTKRYEEISRTTLSEALSSCQTRPPKGEYVLVIEGRSTEELEREQAAAQEAQFAALSLSEHVQSFIDRGMDKKEAMRAVAKERGISKREVYQALIAEENQ